jgi:hypothetical protein
MSHQPEGSAGWKWTLAGSASSAQVEICDQIVARYRTVPVYHGSQYSHPQKQMYHGASLTQLVTKMSGHSRSTTTSMGRLRFPCFRIQDRKKSHFSKNNWLGFISAIFRLDFFSIWI